MKIATLTPEQFKNNGIQTVEKNLIQYLEAKKDVEVQRINYEGIQRDFPLSNTLDNILRPYIVENRIPDDVDLVFVPEHMRMNFNPENIEAEVVIYVHDLFPQTHYYDLQEKNHPGYTYYLKYFAFLAEERDMKNLMKADKILTASNYVKQDLETHTPFQGELKTIYQGVDDMPEISEPEDKSYDLIYVGSDLARKNPELIRKSLTKAQEKGFKVATANFEKLNFPGDTYTGLTNKELARLYASSRYYLHASYVEGFGRCAVEAQRYGCIPMALDTPINREVLGDAFIAVKNEDDVVKQLERNRIPENVEKVKRNAERFTWKKTLEKLKEAVLK
ncbi:MAG: glycosyltransferase [Candidatus Nanohalobium sp.]